MLKNNLLKSHFSLLLFLLVLMIAGSVDLATAQDGATTATEVVTSGTIEAATPEITGVTAKLNEVFGLLVSKIFGPVLFFEVGGIPLIIIVLVLGGVFFTVFYNFINIRLIKHSVDVVRGKYDDPDDEGEISHFKALTSALSATVGLGNISGVAVAIAAGGAGAIFWMWVTAVFGMSLKFSSCTMSQFYRRIKDNGQVMGGPMIYLEEGIKEQMPSMAWLGKGLGILFACLTIMAAFGGGNMFQANQTYSVVADIVPWQGESSAALKEARTERNELAIALKKISDTEGAEYKRVEGEMNAVNNKIAEYKASLIPGWFGWFMGFFLAIPAGLVIIGGIKRIGEVTCRLVPAMCLFYCFVCLIIILKNFTMVPEMLVSIFAKAFSSDAVFGGFLGVLVQGMKRAAFSNEAGLGSAAIAHAAAKTKEPVREGVVAMMGPFIDTICVCTMTALAILISGADKVAGLDGIQITSNAFSTLSEFAPYLLCVAVFVFAFSTLISWCYYGERAVEYLFGEIGIMPYRIIYCSIIVLGPILSLGAVLEFSDIMLLSMAFPNIIGLVLLSGKLKSVVNDYQNRLKSGEMKMTK